MEMQQVRYFLALSRTLNFTRAAEQAGVTQPALTRAIQQLEAELGGPLFHREGRKTHLSELGRLMLPYLEGIQAQAEAARSQARALQALDGAVLHIGAMCTVGPAIVSDLLVAFRAANPAVELRVSDMAAAELLGRLDAGELDVGLLGLPGDLDDRFHGVPLFRERFVVAAPRGHRFATQNMVRAQELHEEPYVSRASCEYFDHARQTFHARGVLMRKVFSSERDDWVQGMIKAGLGLGFIPEFSVTDPDLVIRELIDPSFERTIMLVTVRGRPHAPAVGAFVRQARAFGWPGPRDLT